MTVICREAEKADLKAAMAVVAAALNDLERRHGFEGISEEIDTSFAESCLADDPSGLWVAEAGDRIVGFGFSWVAERLWYLADLFVEPRWQSSGVGRMLLERTLDQARQSSSSVHALITFAYNRTSLGLYMKHGMYPRMPLYAWSAARGRLTTDRSEARLGHEPLVEESQLDAIARIDHNALGISRQKHHRFSLNDPSVRGFLLKHKGGTPAGYVYVSRDGHIGPIAVASPALMRPAFASALDLAHELGSETISAFVPGACDEVLASALRSGMRLGRTMVFVSSEPFGDWTRYCPRDPGYM
jgi:GNAT superfamily N-acetyltransferase